MVSFDVGGIREIIDKNNGRIIEAFDTKSMALVLLEIKNNKVRFHLEESNLDEFDWEKSSSKMLLIMNDRLYS